MKLRLLTSLLLIAPALLPGQDKTTLLYPGPVYAEIKQYLSLSDAQIQSLQAVLESRSQVMQSVYIQINQKNEALYQLLNSDSGTAAQLGQLLIDIRNLEKQLPLNGEPFKTQALNVLTDVQKAKLPKLAEALQLQNTAGQAAMLLLVDYPPYQNPTGMLAATAGPGLLSAPAAFAPRLQLLPAKR